mmetsp:Transcript_37140/g.89583  ORF Transcript_37140/g.89583 Transcript_37140/m.89583 type:complete len:98 (+) Transcript_37140:205-498(+)
MEYQWRDIHADSSLESSLSSSDEAESVISSAAPFDDDDNSGREQEGDTERDGSFNDIDIEDELDEEELETLTVTMLKKRPKKRDLKFSGKKAELIDR